MTNYLMTEKEQWLDGYQQGRADAMQYIIDRGQSLLESSILTSELAKGVFLMMLIARGQKEQNNVE